MQRKSLYYDLDGELLKILEAQKFKLIDEQNGKYLATEIIMENMQNGRKSIINNDNG